MNSFTCSKTAYSVLQTGNILWKDETPEQMIDRIIFSIKEIEVKYFPECQSKDDTSSFSKRINNLLYQKKIVPSTPILTNLGRIIDYPLSACVVPDVDFTGSKELLKQKIDQLHLEGMGTWFNFSWLQKPIELILYLNSIAEELQNSGEQNRPVGNMWVMSIYDAHIFDFIRLKENWIQQWINWKFNFSVDIDQSFINSLMNKEQIILSNWAKINAQDIFDEICNFAYLSGDPWIVRLDKMNESNPMVNVSPYTATAPCWEVWLAAGEACQFASINLSELVVEELNQLDFESLKFIVFDLVRFLDDCLEYSIYHYSDWLIQSVMSVKRKIGIWICWFADLLIKLKIEYWSKDSIQLWKDIMSYINYYSKLASIELAKQRWSFPGINISLLKDEKYFSKKYWNNWSRLISYRQWLDLDKQILTNGIRHISTTAIPPTGRSSIVFDTSQQIEPLFNLRDYDGNFRKDLLQCLWNNMEAINEVNISWTCQCTNLMNKRLFRTSQEISTIEHLEVLVAFQNFTDEAVSKTINMPQNSTISDIKSIYLKAFELQLKWMTIYRDWSRDKQPINLS